MTLEEFEDLVDRCGELPAQWPSAVRQEALAFLAGSTKAQAIVADTAALRDMFGRGAVETAPANLADRIVALAGRMDDVQPSFTKEKRPQGLDEPRTPRSRRINLPKAFLWLVVCSAAGLGLIHGAAGGWPHIDFATLFAALSGRPT